VIKDILNRFNIRLNKDLGQHFLADTNLLNKIADTASLTKHDLVLEIGTGLGTLTKALAAKAGFVITVEIDKKMIEPAKEYLKGIHNIEILNQDILKLHIEKALSKHKQFEHLKVVANVPYYISTPIITNLLEGKIRFELIIMTIQKEFAERIVSDPGRKQYSSFSIFVNFYTKPKKMFDIPASAFIPMPAVGSSVIRLEVLDKPSVDVKDRKLFFRIVRGAFAQRRKMLKNTIENANIPGVTRERIAKALELTGIDGMRRGETLSIDEFARLANSF